MGVCRYATKKLDPWPDMFQLPDEENAILQVAKRLDHEHARMLRLRPDGGRLTWSVAAMSRFQDAGRAPKPFFITWDDPSMRPDKVGDTLNRDLIL